LKKTGTEPVVIDGAGVGRASRPSSSTGSGDLLDILNDCLDATQSLLSLVAEAPRITPLRYSDEWKTRLADTGARLDSLGLELQMQPDAGPAETSYLKAVDGFDRIRQAYDEIVATANGNRVIPSALRRSVSSGANDIEEAMRGLRSVDRSQSAAAAAPDIDPIAAANSIRLLCSRFGAEGSNAYNDCVVEQDAAKNALIGRTGPAVGLDAASFNKIRNGCLYEWPDNYVNRNACEVRRASAAAGG
jgi:hypothetical protein